jgi:hypothetical protein
MLMDGTLVALQVAQLLAVAGFALLVWRYLPKYVEKKAENLATKEDIAEITAMSEQAKVPYVEALERLRMDLQREESHLTNRQQMYVQLAESAAAVFLGGRKITDEDNSRFLSAHAALFLYGTDEIVNAFNEHIDLQIRVAALPAEAKPSLQPELQRTLAALLVRLRCDAFYPRTSIKAADFRFLSFQNKALG